MLKRIFAAALVWPLLAHAQSYPSPIFNQLTVNTQNPSLLVNVSPGTASARQLQAFLKDAPVSVINFGADPTGTVSSSAAIQAAINYACASPNQKTVYEPPGIYLLNTGLTINACDGVKLVGAGAGGDNDVSPIIQAPTINRWTGTSGGTALTISAGTTHAFDNGVMGIFWDGNSDLGATAVSIVSGKYGTYDIRGTRWAKTIVDTSVSSTVSGNADFTGNHFYRIAGYQSNVGDGSFLMSEKSSVFADSCWNHFDLIQGTYLNSPAVVLNQNDNDYFSIVNVYQFNGGTAKGIVATGSNVSANQVGRNTTFQLVSTGGSQTTSMGGVYVQGTGYTYPAHAINIIWLDGENAQAAPTVDPTATGWWGVENAPPGDRQFYTYTSPSPGYVEVKANGVMRQVGQVTIPAGSTSGTFNYATFVGQASAGFPTGVLSIQVTPITAQTAFSASSTNTTLTINAGSPSAALTFDFTVEGY